MGLVPTRVLRGRRRVPGSLGIDSAGGLPVRRRLFPDAAPSLAPPAAALLTQAQPVVSAQRLRRDRR